METRPPDKRLRLAPFAIHATRGLLRDQRSRRVTMATCLVVALAFLICGLTLFRLWLDPHEHPVRFILYWLLCGWQTVLVLLLAILDVLLLRRQARAARKALRDEARQEDASSD